MEIEVKARAKLNLTLDIVGESRGFHLLDMLVCSIDLYDTVTVRRRTDGKTECYMDGVLQGESNSAVRAVKLLDEAFGTGGFDINIEKRIPLAGGLGGSTADGTAVVRAVAEMMEIDKKRITDEWLLNLGSDGPCTYRDGIKRVRGIGEKIDIIDIDLPYKVAFIAGNGVDTTAAYKLFDTMKLKGGNGTERLLRAADGARFDVADYLCNDLYLPAVKINPAISDAVSSLTGDGARAVNMSGSGSTVYGLFRVAPAKYRQTEFFK